MEKKDSKDRVNIKLTYLDLFPSLEEIDSNNEGITINFQNSSVSYNLSELIKSLDELHIPNQIPNQTIKILLLKSGAIYATGLFTVKNGEQWVTFNYEHKKKTTSNLALSLIDCIKIKFFCNMEYISYNIDNENNNNILSNTEISKKIDNNNNISKPSPKKLYNNSTSKKKSGYIDNMVEIIGDPLDSLHTEESKITKYFENISNDIKNNEGNNILNNTTLPSNKKSHKNPLIKSENLSDFNPLAASSGVVGKDFRIKDNNKNKNAKKTSNNNINQKKLTTNKLSEKKKSNNNNLLNTTENNSGNKYDIDNFKQKTNLKKNKNKDLFDSLNKANRKDNKSNTNNFIRNYNTSNQNNSSKKVPKENSPKFFIPKKEEETNEDSINNLENMNNPNNNLINQISKEIQGHSDKNKKNENFIQNDIDNYNDDMNNFYQDNFSKKLEDFRLLYTNDYIKRIKQEDYVLEIELYIEKLIELISEYHLQIEEKEIEYQLIKNIYNKHIHMLSEQNKLLKKLKLMKDDYNIKEISKKTINNHHNNNKKNNLFANKEELNIFNFILYSHKTNEEKENKEKLKKILKNILNKPKHKNIINQNKKIAKWVKLNMDKSEPFNEKEKGKKRINTGKISKTQQEDRDKGKYIKKKKNINNISDTPTKGKNKLNKK